MHYYKFNIADYRKDTGHLTTIEHGIYRQLIDWYYLDEKPIPIQTQVVMRRLRLGSDQEDSLQNVLNDFFTKGKDGYRQCRIDFEIKEYHSQADKNRTNGKLGGRPKKTQPVIFGNPDESQNNPNHKPLTNKPLTKDKSATIVAFVLPEWIDKNLWDGWHSTPKRKNATDEQKTLAVKKITKWRDEGLDWRDALEKSAIGGYQGLFAPSVSNGDKGQALTFAERDQLAKQKRWEEMTGRKWPTESQYFIDVDSSVLELK
jgi:uncharacterized protein YdaU (DUF1376 family)